MLPARPLRTVRAGFPAYGLVLPPNAGALQRVYGSFESIILELFLRTYRELPVSKSGAALGVGQGMDLGRAATTRSPEGLNFRPPFPPAAERWAFTWVESMARSSGIAAAATRVAKMRCQMPRWLQRLKRL